MGERLTSVLIEDPELGEGLSERRRAIAQRDCVARVARVRAGQWQAQEPAPGMRLGLGLLILGGLLIRRVGLNRRFGAELLGAGDVLRPWDDEDATGALPHSDAWRVLEPTRLAVLDSAFAVRAARYPEVTSALFGRAIRRSRNLAVHVAIVHQPRIDVRLHMLLWALADRWGRVTPDGVRLPVRLTHAILGELVAAHRPSVTKALAELAESDAVHWVGDAWLLRGGPPVEFGGVRALSLAANKNSELAPASEAGAGAALAGLPSSQRCAR
jgi:CRP/FNR family transcriptional regulator, cyclic AMP receptor protein